MYFTDRGLEELATGGARSRSRSPGWPTRCRRSSTSSPTSRCPSSGWPPGWPAAARTRTKTSTTEVAPRGPAVGTGRRLLHAAERCRSAPPGNGSWPRCDPEDTHATARLPPGAARRRHPRACSVTRTRSRASPPVPRPSLGAGARHRLAGRLGGGRGRVRDAARPRPLRFDGLGHVGPDHRRALGRDRSAGAGPPLGHPRRRPRSAGLRRAGRGRRRAPSGPACCSWPWRSAWPCGR